MRKNNVINYQGLIGEATIEVRWQGTRTVCKQVYNDVDEFNREWTSIDGFWSKESESPRKVKLNSAEKEQVERFLARVKSLKLED